ncbi:melanoma-associated antigen B10-like [Macrosteles quadrilineatus]|uniref:melanoma-associated antigen B10-like n=1 Tax=Macrosteles quadrilineatus TaxID=74068 RepID=UPI0023E10AB4|nr:melanoma-associated antigen B10-like [Macrosteles quadrilineatus]
MSSQRKLSQHTKKSRIENSQLSQSQASQSSSQRSRTDNLTEEQLEVAVQNVTAFLLCEMSNKRKIRKDDVVANALNKSARQYAEIMKRSQAILDNVFGLQIARDPDHSDIFIILNKHQARFVDLTLGLSTDGDVQDDLILTVVLGSIFMNRGQMYESHLMTILETVGFLSDKFYGSEGAHKMKDHVANLVKKTFVKQMYLDAEVVARPQQQQRPPLPEGEMKVTVYKWGYRAMLEVNLDKLVDYLVKMHDGKVPQGFSKSYFNDLKKRQFEMKVSSF